MKGQTMHHKHVLIADDDPFIQKTLKFSLEEAGYIVSLAQNGREAIECAEALRPPVILLDVYMPDCDGIEALLELKRRLPQVRVFMMSGGGATRRYDFLEVATKFGAEGVIRKPLSVRALAEILSCETPRLNSPMSVC